MNHAGSIGRIESGYEGIAQRARHADDLEEACRRGAALERCRALLGMADCVDPPEPPSLRCPTCPDIRQNA